MSRANLAVFEWNEFSEFAANVNFSSLRNLASNKLFFTSFISLQQPLYDMSKLLKFLIVSWIFLIIDNDLSEISSEILLILDNSFSSIL